MLSEFYSLQKHLQRFFRYLQLCIVYTHVFFHSSSLLPLLAHGLIAPCMYMI